MNRPFCSNMNRPVVYIEGLTYADFGIGILVPILNAGARRPVHRLDEPIRLSLSMVTSSQCRFRSARQTYCSSSPATIPVPCLANEPPVPSSWLS